MAAFAAIPTQSGVVGAGALLLVLRRVDDRAGSAIGVLLAATLAAVIWRMRHHYSVSLVETLREGLSDEFTIQFPGFSSMARDADARATLLAGAADERPDVRRLSAEIIGRAELSEGVSAVTALLDDEDLAVRLAALEALERLADTTGGTSQPDTDRVLSALFPDRGPRAGLDLASPTTRARTARWLARAGELTTAGNILTRMLSSSDSQDRREAVEVISSLGWAPDGRFIGGLLVADPSSSVRSAASSAVAALHGAGDQLHRGFFDRDPAVRLAVAEAWREADGAPEPMLAFLEREPPFIWEAAIIALGNRAAEVNDRVVAWAGPRIVDAATVRTQHAAISEFAEDPTMPAASYLASLLEERVLQSHRVAVRILALLQPEETARLIIEGLGADDADVRAQALEAAETLGGSLAHQVVRILEGSIVGVQPTRTVIAQLTTDPDPWVRVLAVRSVAEMAAKDWATVVAPTTRDPDQRVRETAMSIVARLKPDMGQTLDTVGRLDRMLWLRRVPIFGSLPPEDLDRLAHLAVERTFSAGKLIFRTGEPSQAMLLIVDGAVDLGPEDHPLFERLGPGDHIGELAALCGQSRTTDAIARRPTRVLAIETVTLDRLLGDRPDVMRQMLSDLAGRLTQLSASTRRS